jgi:hypothetical protein
MVTRAGTVLAVTNIRDQAVDDRPVLKATPYRFGREAVAAGLSNFVAAASAPATGVNAR